MKCIWFTCNKKAKWYIPRINGGYVCDKHKLINEVQFNCFSMYQLLPPSEVSGSGRNSQPTAKVRKPKRPAHV